MGVVFDEVVTQVEAPSEQRQQEPQQSHDSDRQSAQEGLRCWRNHQATDRRRELRREAD